MTIQEITTLFFPSGTDTLGDIIGPQGNLLEKLEVFNEKYMIPEGDSPLKVTKTWRWGNGTYDRVKDCYSRKVMQWHKRPRGMVTLFNRERAWFKNDMKRDLLNIEKYLIDARRDSAIWLDKDSDDGLLEQYLYEFCDNINQLEDILAKEADNWIIGQINSETYYQRNYSRNDHLVQDIMPGILYLQIFLKPKPIKVTRNEEHIVDIPFPPLTLHIKIDVSKWMSNKINPQAIRDGYNARWRSYFSMAFDFNIPERLFEPEKEGDYTIGDWPIFHPFIKSHGYVSMDSTCWYWGNYCWGNFGNSVLDSFFKMDFEAFFLHMNRWLYNYEINGANPLNNIRKSFLGISPELNDQAGDLLDVVGYDGEDCHRELTRIFPIDRPNLRQNVPKVQNYWDKVRSCTFTQQCMPYQRNQVEETIAGLACSLASPEKSFEDKIGPEDVNMIHSKISSKFELSYRHRGNVNYYGIYMIWDEYLEHNDSQDDYAGMIHKVGCMSYRDRAVIAYLLTNECFTSYVDIIALTYLGKDVLTVNEKWDATWSIQEMRVSDCLEDILAKMNESNKSLTEEDKAKKDIQNEMSQWVSKIRTNI